MALTKIHISNIRNIKSVNFTSSSKLNIIVGENGSGKTSILEAIYLIGRGRSFRTQSTSKIITKGEAALITTAQIQNEKSTHQVGIRKTSSTTEIRINKKKERKASELSNYAQVHILRPESQSLLERGATNRRSFIDWGVFHVEHDFLQLSKKHNQALRQRNKLLKNKELKTLGAWSTKVAEYGTMLVSKRKTYVGRLEAECRVVSKALLGEEKINLVFSQGWEKNKTLQAALEEATKKDLLKGFTSVGAHRSDISLYVSDKLAQDYLSRGQMKLLIFSLYLAQVKVSSRESDVATCVLIDDLAAELDPFNIKRVLVFLEKVGAQVFITTTNEKLFANYINNESSSLFHVKHGVIEKVNK